MLWMQLASMNIFCSMSYLENVIFFKSLWLLRDFFNRHIVVLFETSVLKEVRILLYSHNKSTVLMLMLILSSKIKLSYFYHAILCTWIIFVADVFMIAFLTLLLFHCSSFFIINEFFWKTQNISESMFLHNTIEFL